MCENRELKENAKILKRTILLNLKEEIRKVENKYEDEIYQLEKENSFLRKVINTFQKQQINSYIGFAINFQYLLKKNSLEILNLKNDIYLDPEKQIEYEEEQEYEEFEI